VKSFFDTSVLVAAALEDHEHHERSLMLFSGADRKTGCCAAHSLAEIYSTLTRLPGNIRLSPDQALLFLDSVEDRLEIVSLNAREYQSAINDAASVGIAGGAIYDAQANRIYTWDVSDFQRLGAQIAEKVRNP